jgi:hypothetical protein
MLIAVTPIVMTETGEDIMKMYDAGLINQHSIGFTTINSSVGKDGVRTITELKLYEGSAVLWAANPETPTISVKSEVKKEQLANRLEKLLKAFKGGKFTDETFALMEIEIKRIQAELLEIEIVKEITVVAEAPQPIIEEIKNNDAEILKAIKEFNKILKK